MRRYLVSIAAALFCFGVPASVLAVTDPAPAEVVRFLSGKKIIGSIVFSANSAQLNSAAKAKLKDIATQANKTARNTDFLRVEGWAEGGTILAIERAKIVVQFLQEDLKLKHSLYFTGIAQEKGYQDGNRVDLVLYENIFAGDVEEKEILSIFFD